MSALLFRLYDLELVLLHVHVHVVISRNRKRYMVMTNADTKLFIYEFVVDVKIISIGPILHALTREVEGSVLALPPSACRYISCSFSSIDLSFSSIRFSSQLF